jgi:predicted alpha/beta superfamily hydrolase
MVGELLLVAASLAHVGKLDVHRMHSRVLDQARTIRVWTPPHLRRGDRCDVLYLNDGQNLFGDGDPESGGGGWHVDEAVATLMAEHAIPPLIVVGLDNAGDKARGIDYLPVPDPFDQHPEPSGADKYLSFVIDEVMPYVNKHYPTRTGPSHTGFGGSSYGAASAFYAMLSRPGVFGRILLESPSIGVGNGVMLERAKTFHQWPERIDIGIGSEEGRGRANNGRGSARRGNAAIDELADILKADGFGDDRLRIVVQEGGRHNEASWAARFPDAVRFLFKR